MHHLITCCKAQVKATKSAQVSNHLSQKCRITCAESPVENKGCPWRRALLQGESKTHFSTIHTRKSICMNHPSSYLYGGLCEALVVYPVQRTVWALGLQINWVSSSSLKILAWFRWYVPVVGKTLAWVKDRFCSHSRILSCRHSSWEAALEFFG